MHYTKDLIVICLIKIQTLEKVLEKLSLEILILHIRLFSVTENSKYLDFCFFLEQIKNFHSKRNNNKWKATYLHLSVTLLGAISTVVLGIKLSSDNILINYIKNIALTLAALITLISGYNTFFDHKDLWINYTKTRNEFYSLKFELGYYLKGNTEPKAEEIDKYKDRYNDILNRANKDWFGLRKS